MPRRLPKSECRRDQITVPLKQAERERIERLAVAQDRSLASVIRLLINEGMQTLEPQQRQDAA
jgi:hypothetical protein